MDIEKAKEMRLGGTTYQGIASEFSVSKQYVHQILSGLVPKVYHTEESKRQKRLASMKMNNQKVKVEVLTHYGGGKLACVRCSFNDIRALSIDHINGDGHRHRKITKLMGSSLYYRLRKEGFPQGYQTLCMNCQYIKKIENNEY